MLYLPIRPKVETITDEVSNKARKEVFPFQDNLQCKAITTMTRDGSRETFSPVDHQIVSCRLILLSPNDSLLGLWFLPFLLSEYFCSFCCPHTIMSNLYHRVLHVSVVLQV
jgi:hypothetical protein